MVGGGLWGGGEVEGGGLAARLVEGVLVVDLVVGFAVGAGASREVFEDECVAHGCVDVW